MPSNATLAEFFIEKAPFFKMLVEEVPFFKMLGKEANFKISNSATGEEMILDFSKWDISPMTMNVVSPFTGEAISFDVDATSARARCQDTLLSFGEEIDALIGEEFLQPGHHGGEPLKTIFVVRK